MLEKRKSEFFDKVYDALNGIIDLETLTEDDVGNLIEALDYQYQTAKYEMSKPQRDNVQMVLLLLSNLIEDEK